jgi:hypothetical protein
MLIYSVLSFPSPINSFGDRLRRENEAKGRCFEERPASQIKAMDHRLAASSKLRYARFRGDDE